MGECPQDQRFSWICGSPERQGTALLPSQELAPDASRVKAGYKRHRLSWDGNEKKCTLLGTGCLPDSEQQGLWALKSRVIWKFPGLGLAVVSKLCTKNGYYF